MRQEWWLEQRDHVWCVVGYNADDSLWVRPASEVEISLWQWLNSALKRAAVAEDALARLTPLMAEVERRYLENFSCPKASDLGLAIQALLDALAPAPD